MERVPKNTIVIAIPVPVRIGMMKRSWASSAVPKTVSKAISTAKIETSAIAKFTRLFVMATTSPFFHIFT